MICEKDISNIKTKLNENIGKKVLIKGKLERKKTFEEEAIIENTYPYFFNLRLQGKKANNVNYKNYKYVDILSNQLQISIFNGEEYFPLEPEILITKI